MKFRLNPSVLREIGSKLQKLTQKLADALSRKITVAIGVAVLLCIANLIQKQFLYPFAIGPRSSLFYLPAAIITLGSLVSPITSLSGIFIGALISNFMSNDLAHLPDLVLISLVPTFAAGISTIVIDNFNSRFRDFHRVHDRFTQIDAIDIFYFCCLYAIVNVSLSKLLFYFKVEDPVAFPPVMVLAMAFGDITGSFLVFIALNLMFSLYLRIR